MGDGGALADAADHEPAIDPAEQGVEVGVLRGIGTDHRVLDRHADAGVDEPRHHVEARVLVGPEVAFVFQVEDEAEAGGVRDLPEPRFEAGGVPRVAAGQRHRDAEAVPAQQGSLVHGPPEGRADARDRPMVPGEPGHPLEQLLVLGQRHVMEERVAPVQEPREAARGHVTHEPVALGEVDRAPAGSAAGQRGHGEHAAQIVGGERCHLHCGRGGASLSTAPPRSPTIKT